MAKIVVNPRILGGKPIIEGTRISVEFILDLLASDVSEEEILEDYPHLTKEDIHACLRYAARSYRNEVYYVFGVAVGLGLSHGFRKTPAATESPKNIKLNFRTPEPYMKL